MRLEQGRYDDGTYRHFEGDGTDAGFVHDTTGSIQVNTYPYGVRLSGDMRITSRRDMAAVLQGLRAASREVKRW